jgi:hypothetical protein
MTDKELLELAAKPKLYINVELSNGASMLIPNPESYIDGGVEWQLRYGNAENVRYMAAGFISSYDYLLSDNISLKEATSRLIAMRKARRNSTRAAAEIGKQKE